MALEPHLDSALTQAIRLAEPRRRPPSTTPRPAARRAGRRSSEGQDQITPDNWEDQIAKLKALLGEGGDVRLELHWSLQKKGPR